MGGDIKWIRKKKNTGFTLHWIWASVGLFIIIIIIIIIIYLTAIGLLPGGSSYFTFKHSNWFLLNLRRGGYMRSM
jgi:hypothetical protein